MKLLVTTMIMTAMATTAIADAPMSQAEIASLPREQVQAVKELCAKKWGNNFEMRVYCEDQQYKALKTLVVRGSE